MRSRRNSFIKAISKTGGSAPLAPAPVPQPQAAPPSGPFPPGPPPGSAPNMPPGGAMGGSLDPLSSTILWLNTNPYFVGMFMLLLNLGGRFLALELTKKQEAFLQGAWIRPIIFFTVVFVATRNIVAAFWITLLFFFVIWVAANENSPFCMIPSWCGHDTQTQAKIYEANVFSLHSRNSPA